MSAGWREGVFLQIWDKVCGRGGAYAKGAVNICLRDSVNHYRRSDPFLSVADPLEIPCGIDWLNLPARWADF